MRPSNWDRPGFGPRGWGDRFDVPLKDREENGRRQQNPFNFRPPQIPTQTPSIVGEIPGQIGQNPRFGQRGQPGNDNQPPPLPPMPRIPGRSGTNPTRGPGIEVTEPTEIPGPTQPPRDQNPWDIGHRGRKRPDPAEGPKFNEIPPLPQTPINPPADEEEEKFGSFEGEEGSNLNPVGQGRRTIPGQMGGSGRNEFPSLPQPGLTQTPTGADEPSTPQEQFSTIGGTGVSRRQRPGPSGRRGMGRGQFEENEQDMSSSQESDRVEPSEAMEPQRVLAGTKQHHVSGSSQLPVGRDKNKKEDKIELETNLGGAKRFRQDGTLIAMQPAIKQVQRRPEQRQEELERKGLERKSKQEQTILGKTRHRQVSTSLEPPLVHHAQEQQKDGIESEEDSGFRQASPRQSSGKNPIHPRRDKETESQIGGPRDVAPNGPQVPFALKPREVGQRREVGRKGSRDRNVPTPRQYPGDLDETGDAEIITPRSRGGKATTTRPLTRRRPVQGSDEQDDLEGVEIRTPSNASRPPRG